MLSFDNKQINEDVLKRKDMNLDDTPRNTFQEDSFYPETEACMHLLKEVDKVIHKEINPGITHSPYYRFYLLNKEYFGQRYFPPEVVDYQNILRRNKKKLFRS